MRDQAESRAVPGGRQAGRHALADGGGGERCDEAGTGQAVRRGLVAAAAAVDDQVGLGAVDQLRAPTGDSAQDRAVPPGQGFPVDHVRWCRVRCSSRPYRPSLPVVRSADPVAARLRTEDRTAAECVTHDTPGRRCASREITDPSRASRIRVSAARSAGARRAKNSSASAPRAARMAVGDLLAARGQGDQGGAPVGWVGVALDEPAHLQRVDDLRRRPGRDAQVLGQRAEPDRAVPESTPSARACPGVTSHGASAAVWVRRRRETARKVSERPSGAVRRRLGVLAPAAREHRSRKRCCPS